MVNFHGANKPTGESRTYPNEMTREAVRGLEFNKWSYLTRAHYAALPFTRMIAGHADFTPCTFNPEKTKGTTFTHQLATAVIYNSPVLHFADKPQRYFDSPAIEIIKKIPATWDRTIVLDDSRIGSLAAFARKKDNQWFIAVITAGKQNKNYKLKLPFLEPGKYKAVIATDVIKSPAAINVQAKTIDRSTTLDIKTNPGGGFVAYLKKIKN
jgi:alpha-glucosidase